MEEITTLNALGKNTTPEILVGTITLSELFKNALSIPDFQRPYEWNDRLVLKLFQDIDNHFFVENNLKQGASDFYLGSVLLNQKENNYFEIIDGQQRLTTFLILDYLLDSNNSVLKRNTFMFHSNVSVKNILEIKKVIETRKDEYSFTQEDLYKDIIKKIRLNIIITSVQQTAFQFFDSLNSKGKKLDTINILKSYHLRELKDENELQKKLAANFDSLNALVESTKYKELRVYSLTSFVSLFWVKHNYWTKGNFSPINKNQIEFHLRDNSMRLVENVKSIKLFPSIRNMRNNEVVIGTDKTTYKSIYEESDGLNNIIEFNPMLTVQKGLGFFISLEKLKHYFDFLFVRNELDKLEQITTLVKSSFNDYFIHLYYLLILGYYIKFENKRLEEFAFEIEQILGNKFLSLQSVRKESPIRIMRDELNILQHIYLNVEPQYLFDELKTYKKEINAQSIEKFERDGKNYVAFKFKHKTIEYIAHGSRPKYVESAKKIYLSKETIDQDYTKIIWEKIDKV